MMSPRASNSTGVPPDLIVNKNEVLTYLSIYIVLANVGYGWARFERGANTPA